jgi:HPt (histidine-containing phosphotransfer) domain-containing protein
MLDLRSTPTVASPSLVPDEPLDRAHLFRMTLGDHSLEGEVLRLFDRQCRMLLARMAAAQPACVKALAHTIDGSARGVGAWRVSHAARDLQQVVDSGGDIPAAIGALEAAIDETLIIVADLLRVH